MFQDGIEKKKASPYAAELRKNKLCPMQAAGLDCHLRSLDTLYLLCAAAVFCNKCRHESNLRCKHILTFQVVINILKECISEAECIHYMPEKGG